MRPYGFAGLRPWPGRPRRRLDPHQSPPLRPVAHDRVGGNDSDHVMARALIGDRARQIHQPAAFGVGRKPGFDRLADFFAQGLIGGEAGGLGFGKTAADEQAVASRQIGVAQGVEEDEPRPGAPQGVEIVGVIEAESLVARDGERDVRPRPSAQQRRNCRLVAPRRGEQGVEIDPLRHDVFRTRDHGVGLRRLARRDEAEVALVEVEAGVARQSAQYAQIGVIFDRLAQFAFLPRRAEFVENDARDFHVAVEVLVAEEQWRYAARHADRIDDENDGRAQKLGERGAGVRSLRIDAVMQALVAFDEREIGVAIMLAVDAENLRRALGVEIEIVARPAAGAREPHRIDIIRPLLVSLHFQASRGKGGGEADGDRRLAGGFRRRRNEESCHAAAPLSTVASAGSNAMPWGRKGSSRKARVVISMATDMPLRPKKISGRLGV